jgi:endonuclease YncB( thermonuclease family)
MYDYVARIVHVIDGDTFVANVDVGFYMYSHQHLRLLNYEAPEIRGAERAIGLLAKTKLEEILPVGLEIKIRNEKADSFGKWLAEVPWEGGTLSEHLMKLEDDQKESPCCRPWSKD